MRRRDQGKRNEETASGKLALPAASTQSSLLRNVIMLSSSLPYTFPISGKNLRNLFCNIHTEMADMQKKVLPGAENSASQR